MAFMRARSLLLTTLLSLSILSAIPLLFPKATYHLTLLFLIFLYIAIAHSWNILGGVAGQVSLGQAAFFGLGALPCALYGSEG
jgi:branched-chain amino acid transport system permease protein